MAVRPPPEVPAAHPAGVKLRRTTWAALIGGTLAYALVKLAGVGIVTGVGPSDVLALPELFLPAMASRVASELFGVSLILTFVCGFGKISPRSGFLSVALVQAAIGWFAPGEWKDTWLRWMFGASGLDQVWEQTGLQAPFQPHSMFGGLSVQDLIACAAAGAVAQAVHNLAAQQAQRDGRPS